VILSSIIESKPIFEDWEEEELHTHAPKIKLQLNRKQNNPLVQNNDDFK